VLSSELGGFETVLLKEVPKKESGVHQVAHPAIPLRINRQAGGPTVTVD